MTTPLKATPWTLLRISTLAACRRAFTLLSAVCLVAVPLRAAGESATQGTPPSPSSPSAPGLAEAAAPTSTEAIVLSPFTVDATRDRGYQAENTLSGSRLNSRWRLTLNYSYTDRVQANTFARDVIPWYGFKTGERGLVVEGVRQNADGSFSVDANAFEPGGAIAEFLQLAGTRPEAGVSTLTTANGLTIAGEIFQMIDDNINDDIRENEQRWGLRLHLFSMFTAYDLPRSFRFTTTYEF